MLVTLKIKVAVSDEAKLTAVYLAFADAEGFPASADDTIEEKLAEVITCRSVTPVDCGFEIVSLT